VSATAHDVTPGCSVRMRSRVDEWNRMTPDERRKVLSGVVDSVTATSDGTDRLEPCEDWRPYVVAAIPGHWVPTERKTGLVRASCTRRELTLTTNDRVAVRAAA
jgi:predicted Fe-S protein YdhL (DUF1289 family)